MPDGQFEELGLTCPSGGDFYVCSGNSTEFIGCCDSDPCADGSGNCPTNDLKPASFDPERYANIPAQSCDDRRRENIFYTCRDNDPPFLGCCATMPCGEGCPSDHLIAATLSEDAQNRVVFEPEASSTSGSSSPTASTSRSSPTSTSSSSSGSGSGSSGLSTGAIAGISVGAGVAIAILAVIIWKCGWSARKRRERGQGPDYANPEMAYNHVETGFDGHQHVHNTPGSHLSFATTAVPSYGSTPTTPEFAKTYMAAASQAQSPPASHQSFTDADNGYLSGNPRHLSHMSGVSAMSSLSSLAGIDSNLHAAGGGGGGGGGGHGAETNLHTVSEIDGVETGPRIELPAENGRGYQPLSGVAEAPGDDGSWGRYSRR